LNTRLADGGGRKNGKRCSHHSARGPGTDHAIPP
jgi:hypothetical protein